MFCACYSLPVNRCVFISNLFPRPDAPRCGIFNAAFAGALHSRLVRSGGAVDVVVPVAEWRLWRWPSICQLTLPSEIDGLFSGTVRYIPYFYIPLVARDLSWLWCSMALTAVAKLVAGCDGVVGSWLYPDAVAASRLAARFGKPCWIRLHGSDRFHLDSGIRGVVCRRALAAAAGITVNAAYMKQELVRRGIPADRITVLQNGIDRNLFYPGTETIREKALFLWAGNMVEIKRPDVAIRAFAGMLQRSRQDSPAGGMEPRLVMAGDGPLRQAMERLSIQLGAWPRIEFTGSLGRKDLAAWMRRAGSLLLTSRSEGMPNVVIEALASGTPVIASAVGDIPLIVHNGENGFIIDTEEVAETVLAFSDRMVTATNIAWNADMISASVAGCDWDHSAKTLLLMMEAAGRS